MIRLRPAALAALIAVASGCAHKPALTSYRLLRLDQQRILVPPGVAAPQPNRNEFAFVANIAPRTGACPEQSEAIRLQPGATQIRAIVNRDLLTRQRQPGWLEDWAIRLESLDCVAPGDGERLARLVVESVPLDPEASYRLLHKPFVSGYVELGPEHQLEVRSPILSDDTTAAAAPEIVNVIAAGSAISVDIKMPGLIGYEIAWYAIRRNSVGLGCHFEPMSARRNIQGAVEVASSAANDYFQFPPQAAYFRLFYKTDENGVTAMVVSGATKEELERRTQAVGRDVALCRRQSGMCVALPRQVGVNPFIRVKVNGADGSAPMGATVSSAIRAAGVSDPPTVLPQLKVARLFGGKPTPVEFDPNSTEILALQLFGGEEIDWAPPRPN